MKEILGIAIFCGVVLAGVWYGPVWWRSHRERQSPAPSIVALSSVSASASQGETKSPEQPQNTVPASSETTKPFSAKPIDKTKVKLRVLNGGAAVGSAGKVVKALQSAGFSLAKGGDAKGDYTGTMVYYLDGHQDEASAVKQALGTDGSLAPLMLAPDTKQETGIAPVVVILGK